MSQREVGGRSPRLQLLDSGHRVVPSTDFIFTCCEIHTIRAVGADRQTHTREYTLWQVMINGIGIVGFRDPHGIRPLSFGKREKHGPEGSTTDFVISSESVVMDMLCFELLREFPLVSVS